MSLKKVAIAIYPWKPCIEPKRDMRGDWLGSWLWVAKRSGYKNVYANNARDLIERVMEIRDHEEDCDEMAELKKAGLDHRGQP
jgi:hypothetical protein